MDVVTPYFNVGIFDLLKNGLQDLAPLRLLLSLNRCRANRL
jgi:hypothetical protein